LGYDESMETIAVRKVSAVEAADLARLNRAFNGVDEPVEALAARLRVAEGVEAAYLAYVGETAVGFACLRLIPSVCDPDPQAELTELYVEPEFRRRGIAAQLVRHVEDLARAAGAQWMTIRVSPKNQAAQSLYRALGYVPDDLTLFRYLQK
jgi:ribosomal protein S18 acetylase RimI-like enzyme